jgi:dTDP-4-amino-4,6-dideoxygalactose transaminase
MTAIKLAIDGGEPEVTIPPPHFRWPLIGPEEEEAVLRQLRSGDLSYGDRAGVVAELEDAFAAFHGLPYAMSTCSGTAALHAAYFALDLDPGDEVLAPAYTHLSTVVPMLQANLVPVLCDVEPESGNLDPVAAAARISPRTRAIVVTHQYGLVCDMDAILALAGRHGLRVVEDCSHAHGSTLRGRLAGTFGDVACFSLQAHKVVPAGEGGMLLTNDAAIFERAALLGHFRRPTAATSPAYAPFVETGYGLKNRLHPLGAALGVVQLGKLPDRIVQRRANLEHFDRHVSGVPGVRPLATPPEASRGGYFRYLLHYLPDELGGLPVEHFVEAARAEGVREVAPGSLVKPLHLTSLFQTVDDRMYRTGWPRRGPHVRREHVHGPGDFPCAERFSELTLQFPAFTEPSTGIVEAYCRALAKVAAGTEQLAASTS